MDAYNVLAVTQFASTVLFNLVVTGLVVWLLRRAEKPFENNPDAPSYGLYTKVSIVLIQSGAMYSVVLGTYLILYYIDVSDDYPQTKSASTLTTWLDGGSNATRTELDSSGWDSTNAHCPGPSPIVMLLSSL